MKKLDLLTLLIFVLCFITACDKTPRSEQLNKDTIPVPTRSAQKSFEVRAKVTAISSRDNTITLDHEKMDGFMEAMKMPYRVTDPSLLKQVNVGAEGLFTIRIIEGEGVISGVHIHQK